LTLLIGEQVVNWVECGVIIAKRKVYLITRSGKSPFIHAETSTFELSPDKNKRRESYGFFTAGLKKRKKR